MASFLSLVFLAGFVVLAYGAGDSKGKMVEIKSRSVDCDKKIAYTASRSVDDCAGKCKKDANCRFAIYNTKERKCGIVPPNFDCTFRRSETEELIGFAYKKFTKRDNIYIGAGSLQNKKGQSVLESSYGTDDDDCKALCDIHPTCKVAYYTAGMGMHGCTLKAAAQPSNKISGSSGTNTAFIAA
ncbi:uncharacterized protein LOC129596417 [Paramacrobiotus metropolitanus]|uniref:uncharacterized protein LOC129596417 n=1 Tax=Paramacrobiotus metropolitanus TaxID=2943436 RepID=UPI002445FB26|nr:uncharacterized protein LOC129596417 [Paramacrobiotus metropolitanus]